MEEAIYGPPGGASQRGATYSTPWFARAAQPPADWTPSNVETSDPHDGPLEVEVGGLGTVGAGPLPDNIEGGGQFPVAAVFQDNSAEDFSAPAPNIIT